jgi:cystathionine beta-lyase
MERIGAKGIAQARNNAKLAGEPDVAPETVFEEWLVKNTKVHLNAGHTYGFGGEGHMRMNIATSRKVVTVALNNMANALGNL